MALRDNEAEVGGALSAVGIGVARLFGYRTPQERIKENGRQWGAGASPVWSVFQRACGKAPVFRVVKGGFVQGCLYVRRVSS